MTPQDPAGVMPTFGIDDIPNPSKIVDPSGYEENNLDKPSTKGSENEIHDEKGPGGGPKD